MRRFGVLPVYLSSIFKWYKSDFLDWRESWPSQERPDAAGGGKRTPGLLDYIALLLPPEEAAMMRKVAGSYKVK